MNYRRAIPIALSLVPLTLLIIGSSTGVSAAATAVRLLWDASPSPDIAGYVVRYGTTPGIHPEAIDVGNVTSYEVGGLPEGQPYYFVAIAYDDMGNGSPKSNEVAVVPGPVPVLLVSASASPNPAPAGELLAYAFSFANLGSAGASGVAIRANLPVDTTFLWATAGGTQSGSMVSWTVGNLPAGRSGAVHLAVRIDSPLPNGTTIISGDYSIDSNETAPVNGSAVATTVAAPLLQVNKIHIPDQVTAGAFAAYRISYSNLGDALATRVVITDHLPPETSFVWATNGGHHSAGSVTWIQDELPPGTTEHLHVIVQVSSQLQGGTIFTSGQSTIISNETTPIIGTPDVVRVMAVSSLRVIDAIDELAGASYVIAKGRHTILITGADFQDGAMVDLGPDLAVGAVLWVNSSRLAVSIDVDEQAAPGPRELTVINPNLDSAILVDALSVVRSPDLNGNCFPDGFEFDAISSAYDTTRGDPGFIDAADLDGDGTVGSADISIFLSYVGKAFPVCN